MREKGLKRFKSAREKKKVGFCLTESLIAGKPEIQWYAMIPSGRTSRD